MLRATPSAAGITIMICLRKEMQCPEQWEDGGMGSLLMRAISAQMTACRERES